MRSSGRRETTRRQDLSELRKLDLPIAAPDVQNDEGRLPVPMAAKTNRSPLGFHDPADRMACRLSNRAVAVVVTSLRVMAPVVVSARKRSSERRSRSEKKTAWPPSGLSDGPSCSLPAFVSRSRRDGSSSSVPWR